jgi:hypothetical protein
MNQPLTFGRPFLLQRDRDISDVSGTGIIADGILFPDGHAAIHWRGTWPLTTPHPDGLESILAIHDHGGQGDLHVLWADTQGDAPENGNEQAAPVDWKAVVQRRERELKQVGEARHRAEGSVRRAYALADRWQAAHGASSFLVKVAGAELRDELDDGDDGGPDHDWHHPTPLSGLVCRRCELAHKFWSGEACTRADQEVTGATGHVYLSTGCFHGDHDYCKSMTGLAGSKRPAECKKCGAKCVCPCHAEQTTVDVGGCEQGEHDADQSESSQRTRGQRFLDAFLHRGPGYEVGANDLQACPYCPGAPMILRHRHLLGMHVETRHARVLDALASGVSLDEVLHNAATGRDLPHEMEA